MNPLEPMDAWSTSFSAVCGWNTGIAAGGLHQVHFALSLDIPDSGFLHVVSVLMAAGCAGAILFAGLAALRNHRVRLAASAMARLRPYDAVTPTSARANEDDIYRAGGAVGLRRHGSTVSE
jgi:hypothetical protein